MSVLIMPSGNNGDVIKSVSNTFTAKQIITLTDLSLPHQSWGDVAGTHVDLIPSLTSVETPSYSNAGGTGNRTSIITASTDLVMSAGAPVFVNGYTGNESYFNPNNQAVAGKFIKFQFAAKKLITEAKWYQTDAVATHGVWKWQGSDDNSNWTDIGSSFTLGAATVQTITELSGNTIGYIYYRLLGISGNTDTGSWQYANEVEFKIGSVTVFGTNIQAYTGGTTPDGVLGLNVLGGLVDLSLSTLKLPNPATFGAYAVTFPAAGTVGLLGTTQAWTGVNTFTKAIFKHPPGTYDAIILGDVVGSEAIGAGMFAARANPANTPFTTFMGWDSTIERIIYFGGGGWAAPDATSIQFLTAPTYSETKDAGRIRLYIKGGFQSYFYNYTATNNAPLTVLELTAISDTAGAAGFGAGLDFVAETATGGTNQLMARIATLWTDATNATRKAKLQLSAYDTAQRIGLEIEASGTVAKIGLYGATPVIQSVATTDLGTVLSDIGIRVAGTAYPITTSGAVVLTGGLTTNDINLKPSTPSALAGDVNNWDVGNSTYIRATGGAADRIITGIVARADGHLLIIANIGTTNKLSFANESASSTAANRLINANAGTTEILPNHTIMYVYDATTARWREVTHL